MEKLNVAIVDDNPLILNTLDELINAEDGLSVIGKADNGADAINMIVDTTPDIVLLDLVMPKIDGGKSEKRAYFPEKSCIHYT